MITRIKDGDDEFIVCGDIGTCIIERCRKCGEKFLRGIWPQSLCPQCEIHEPRRIYSLVNGKVVVEEV